MVIGGHWVHGAVVGAVPTHAREHLGGVGGQTRASKGPGNMVHTAGQQTSPIMRCRRAHTAEAAALCLQLESSREMELPNGWMTAAPEWMDPVSQETGTLGG